MLLWINLSTLFILLSWWNTISKWAKKLNLEEAIQSLKTKINVFHNSIKLYMSYFVMLFCSAIKILY